MKNFKSKIMTFKEIYNNIPPISIYSNLDLNFYEGKLLSFYEHVLK
jgi:hypothetical protein